MANESYLKNKFEIKTTEGTSYLKYKDGQNPFKPIEVSEISILKEDLIGIPTDESDRYTYLLFPLKNYAEGQNEETNELNGVGSSLDEEGYFQISLNSAEISSLD